MMKTLLITLFFSVILMAQENIAQYGISMKMLGDIGKSTLTMTQKDNKYHMVMHLQMEKSLSDVEHNYESYGTFKDGVYQPERFVKYIREGENETTNYYIFNYDKKQIQKYTTVVEAKSLLTSFFSSASEEKVVTESFELLTEFTPNDTLTTFLNAEALLGGKNKMPVTSVGFRKNERNINLYRDKESFKVVIVDPDEGDDYSITICIAPDGLVSDIVINEYTMLGKISVARK